MSAMQQVDRGTEIGAALGIIVFVVVLVVMMTFRFPPTVASVRWTLERGENVMVVRFPESPRERREEIIVRDSSDEPSTVSRIFVTTGDQPQRGTLTDLTAEQRAAWTRVRSDLCQQPPQSSQPPPPVFEIGIRCPRPDGTFGRVILVSFAPDQLPTEVHDLILTTDSPSCTEPLCGW
jgi:hypothetical protein